MCQKNDNCVYFCGDVVGLCVFHGWSYPCNNADVAFELTDVVVRFLSKNAFSLDFQTECGDHSFAFFQLMLAGFILNNEKQGGLKCCDGFLTSSNCLLMLSTCLASSCIFPLSFASLARALASSASTSAKYWKSVSVLGSF